MALDAEFVSVQEEKNFIGDSGDKIVFNETRHALARGAAEMVVRTN